ncbi:MAG: hypothetical protein P8076_04545 [Gammaproteobacteria bacterium]
MQLASNSRAAHRPVLRGLGRVLAAAALAALLTACGGGPSDSDVKAAMDNAASQTNKSTNGFMTFEFKNVHVDKVQKQDNGVYDVDVTFTTSVTALGTTRERTAQRTLRMKKVDGTWKLVGN